MRSVRSAWAGRGAGPPPGGGGAGAGASATVEGEEGQEEEQRRVSAGVEGGVGAFALFQSDCYRLRNPPVRQSLVLKENSPCI